MTQRPSTSDETERRLTITITRIPTASRLLAQAAIIGAITTASAGLANAESLSDNPHGRDTNSREDTTGQHSIDPFGYQHDDPNPLKTREHDQALRDYRREQNQSAPKNP
ncbi:hypothetical protein AB0M45_31230 [Nocardia sp. NPDC051787]|uniref:hypothetical protein n=1 Tax=Nocardia sp. NPDC051787 TaxID=3155415 RepID=UPI0034449E42